MINITIDIQRKYLNEHSLNEDYCFDYVSDLQKKQLYMQKINWYILSR